MHFFSLPLLLNDYNVKLSIYKFYSQNVVSGVFFFTNFLHWRGIMEKELEREMKNKGDEVQRRFHALVRKWDMLAASKVKISSSEKKKNQ